METRDAGTAILVVIHFQKKVFNTTTKEWDDQDFDPTSPTITATDPAGTDKVDAEALIKSDAGVDGYWHYIMQTAEAWEPGIYRLKATGTSGPNSVLEIENILELKKPYS